MHLFRLLIDGSVEVQFVTLTWELVVILVKTYLSFLRLCHAQTKKFRQTKIRKRNLLQKKPTGIRKYLFLTKSFGYPLSCNDPNFDFVLRLVIHFNYFFFLLDSTKEKGSYLMAHSVKYFSFYLCGLFSNSPLATAVSWNLSHNCYDFLWEFFSNLSSALLYRGRYKQESYGKTVLGVKL